jgi:hypothetical protein
MKCETEVRIAGEDFRVLVKGYHVCCERGPVRSRTALRKIVERYVVPSDVERQACN